MSRISADFCGDDPHTGPLRGRTGAGQIKLHPIGTRPSTMIRRSDEYMCPLISNVLIAIRCTRTVVDYVETCSATVMRTRVTMRRESGAVIGRSLRCRVPAASRRKAQREPGIVSEPIRPTGGRRSHEPPTALAGRTDRWRRLSNTEPLIAGSRHHGNVRHHGEETQHPLSHGPAQPRRSAWDVLPGTFQR